MAKHVMQEPRVRGHPGLEPEHHFEQAVGEGVTERRHVLYTVRSSANTQTTNRTGMRSLGCRNKVMLISLRSWDGLPPEHGVLDSGVKRTSL